MSFELHLRELKWRFIYLTISIPITLLISYLFSSELLFTLANPLTETQKFMVGNATGREPHFIFTDVTEAFTTHILISFYVSMVCIVPLLFYHSWSFLEPGLYPNEKRSIGFLFVLSPLCFLLGTVIAYFVVLPIAWAFFLGFEGSLTQLGTDIFLEAKISEYLTLSVRFLFIMGFFFQYPVLLLILINLSILTVEWMIKRRKIFCILSFILAALFSPPDIASQLLIAVPLILFYEGAILTLFLTQNYKDLHLVRGYV